MLARLIILGLLLTSTAFAGPTLDVQAGFGGRQRADRWNPVFVTLSNDQPISAHISVTVGDAVMLHRVVGVGPQAATYIVYAPLAEGANAIQINVVDAATNKAVISYPNEKTPPPAFDADNSVDFFILTSGRAPALRGFSRSIDNAVTSVQTVKQSFLPTTPAGYDAIDLLFLNDPDWSALSIEQQRAMLAWIDSGGVLMLWPGVEAIPASAPLADALPADIGNTVPLAIPSETLKSAGLPDRFASISQRLLTPRDQTALVPLIGDIRATVARHGLGRIILLPIDAAALQFKSLDKSQAFWNALFDPIFGRPAPGESVLTHYSQGQTATAAQNALDRIGTLPNVGTFSFSYVLLVVGGMIFLVGPLDYFVLKKLRRQPFTWATTALWIALITTGALYAGHFVQSGQLYFRTLQVIDQVNDHVIGHDEVALIYAPRSDRYSVQPTGTSWWQTVPENRRLNNSTLNAGIDLLEDDRGTTPMPLWIDVWNWQFLMGRSYEASPPVVEASLHVREDHVVGTLRNLSASPLTELRIEIADQRAILNGSLAPGATLNIDLPLDAAKDTYENLFNLSSARDEAFHRPTLAGFVKTAALFASIGNASPDLVLDHPNARTEHSGLLRATIELNP